MQLEKEFKKWLVTQKRKKNGAPMSESSAYKYARAINTVSEDMINDKVLENNIYNIDSSEELKTVISRIKGNNAFNIKNEIGHKMYSVALDHYMDFIFNR